ncbi:MAG TPA: MarR family transcriptional regulator [Pirellulales bacterium]
MPTTSSSPDADLLGRLRRHGPLTVQQLTKALEVTPTAVRQRLQRLMASGLIQRELRPRGRGRPSHQYGLTEKAKRRSGADFSDLATVLWQTMAGLTPELREQLLEQTAERLASRYRGEVHGVALEGRLDAMRQVLAEHGMEFEVERTPRLSVLKTSDCPYPDLAQGDRSICEMEQRLFSKILERNVQLAECRLDGHACCRFETCEPSA